MITKLCTGIFLLFIFTYSVTSTATEAVPVPLPPLPATFKGTLPCASCEEIQTQITLRGDGTYFMRQIYKGIDGPNVANDLGRWVTSHYGNVLVLKGQGEEVRYFRALSPDSIVMLDLDARTILSNQNYTLQNDKAVDLPELALFPLYGLYQFSGNSGRFTECASGLDLPVVEMGEHAKLEKAYVELRGDSVKPMLARVYGRVQLVSSTQGSRDEVALYPLRFESMAPGVCPPRLTSADLKDQFWQLVQLKGQPVAWQKKGRPPGLMLHSEGNRLSGSGGCNQLLGSYELNGQLIAIKTVAATRMACLHDMNLEQEFASTLTQVKSWNILGQRMEFYDQLGQLLVRFELP